MAEKVTEQKHGLADQLPPKQYLAVHLIVGLVVSAISLWVFGMLADSVLENDRLVQFDQNFATVLHTGTTLPGNSFFILVSFLGFQFLWVLAIILAIFFAVRHNWAHLITWAVAWLGGELLNQILKQFFARARPVFADPVLTAVNYSFPSGHAMFSCIMYGLLAYFALLGLYAHRTRVAVIMAAMFLILLIGFSRLYLGVHYFSDVVAGFAAGALWLSVCITGMNVYRAHKSPTTREQ